MNAKSADSLRILVVDDETVVRESLTEWFREDGHETRAVSSGRDALVALKESPWDLALLDIKMPGMDGMELQARIAEISADTTIIIMTAYATVGTAVQALKAGAYDYITKPFDPEHLSHTIRRIAESRTLVRENRELKERLDKGGAFPPILGKSEAVQKLLERIEQVAPTPTTVMVTGESGVGKELVARAIHARSPRAYMPLVTVNCGALPEGILESELFGHEKGAFTGAQYRHKGKFELADGGTLFLDEVAEVTPRIQVELLRVLEEKRVVRLGGNDPVRADFRLVAATNQDLAEAMRAGRFREDLYYRLNVFSIHVPALRGRPEDVPLLARAFIERIARSLDREPPEIQPDAMRLLERYSWPGNVRQLANVIEQAVVSRPSGPIRAQDLSIVPGGEEAGPVETPWSLASVERDHVAKVLEDTEWNISRTARLLEVDRKTVYHKIKQYGLQKDA